MAQAHTRKEQSLKIYSRILTKNPDPKVARGKVIAELVAKLGMTPGGASTYYANAKNGNWSLTAGRAQAVVKPAVKPMTPKPKLVMVPAPPADGLMEQTLAQLTALANTLSDTPFTFKTKAEAVAKIHELQG